MKNIKLFPILLVLYEVTVYLSNDMYLPAVPQLMRDLNIDTHMAQLTLASWFLGGVSLSLILGPISDYYGRRPVVLLGGVLYVGTTLICALTSNINLLLVARFFEGATQCSVVVAGYAAIHELFETKQAIRILALMGSIVVLGPAFGPLAGSLVLMIGSWRMIFIILAIASSWLLLLLYKYMPESNLNIRKQPLAMKATLISYLKIIKHPGFYFNTLSFCLLFCALIAWITAGPFIIISNLGYSALLYGIIQVLVFGCLIVGVQFVNLLMERLGIYGLILTGLIISLGGGVVMWLATFSATNLTGMVIGLMIFSFGSSFTFAPFNRLAMEAGQEPMGAKMAVFSTAMTGFGVIGSGLVTLLATNNLPSMARFILIFIALACLLSIIKWRETLKHFKTGA